MSEQHTETSAAANGSAAPNQKREQVARVSIDGTTASAKFAESYENAVVSVDVGGLLPEGTPANVASLAVFGAMHALRGALRAEDPLNAARTVARKISDGSWTTQTADGRTKAPAEPDVFDLALVEHLRAKPERADFGTADVSAWLTAYAQGKGWKDRFGNPAVTRARTALSQHSALAPIIARLVAERARAVAQAARKQPMEELV